MDLLNKLGLYAGFLPCEPATEEINQNFRKLDALSQISVIGQVAALPPTGSVGDAYIVQSTGHVWVFEDQWKDYGVQEGWIAYDQSDSDLYVYTNGIWDQWEDVSKNRIVQKTLQTSYTSVNLPSSGILEDFRVTLLPTRIYVVHPDFRTQVGVDTGRVQLDFLYDGANIGRYVKGDVGGVVSTSLNYDPSYILVRPTVQSDLTISATFLDGSEAIIAGSSILIEEKRDVEYHFDFVI